MARCISAVQQVQFLRSRNADASYRFIILVNRRSRLRAGARARAPVVLVSPRAIAGREAGRKSGEGIEKIRGRDRRCTKRRRCKGKKPEENAMRSSRSILPSLRAPSTSWLRLLLRLLHRHLLLVLVLIVFLFFFFFFFLFLLPFSSSLRPASLSHDLERKATRFCLSSSLDSPAANLASFDALEYVHPLAPNKRTRSKDTRQAYRHTANANALHPDNIGRM